LAPNFFQFSLKVLAT